MPLIKTVTMVVEVGEDEQLGWRLVNVRIPDILSSHLEYHHETRSVTDYGTAIHEGVIDVIAQAVEAGILEKDLKS